MAKPIAQLDAPMAQIIGSLNSAAIAADERVIMEKLIELARPYLPEGPLARYDERQRQLRMPLKDRMALLCTQDAYTPNPDITDGMSGITVMTKLAEKFNLTFYEVLDRNEIELAAINALETYRLISAIRTWAMLEIAASAAARQA